MLPSITTEIMRNNNFFTDAQNLWRKSRFHELGIRRMPSFFSLICTLVKCYITSKASQYRDFRGYSHQVPSKDMRQIAFQQIIEAVNEAESITLKYDGTTKNGCILTEVELEMESGAYLCGVREQVVGSVDDTANTIIKVLEDVSAIKSDKRWIQKIKNTMSDGCIVNSAIENILEDKIGHQLNRIKCVVHPLDTMARDSDKAIQEMEGECAIDKPKDLFINRKESIMQGVIRGIGKLWFNNKFGLAQELKLCYTE